MKKRVISPNYAVSLFFRLQIQELYKLINAALYFFLKRRKTYAQ